MDTLISLATGALRSVRMAVELAASGSHEVTSGNGSGDVKIGDELLGTPQNVGEPFWYTETPSEHAARDGHWER